MGAAGGRAVAVFGSANPEPGDEAYEQARAAGRRLAELGWALANGGYGGTMEAAARGAVEAGGHTIGVTCTVWGRPANRYVREVIETPDLAERIARLVELGRAGYLLLPGATGTLLEFAWVWERMAKGMMPRRPIVCLGTFWRPVIQLVSGRRRRSAELVAVIRSVDELSVHFPPAGPGRAG